MPFDADSARELRASGQRVTAVRLAVLSQVNGHPHVDVETIYEAVGVELGGVSRQAIYDALRTLTAANLVRRLEPAGSPALYEGRVGDNHHHVVCRSCWATADVDCAVGSAPCLDPSDAQGYLLDEAEVTYWGLCPTCQSAEANRETLSATGRTRRGPAAIPAVSP